MAGIAVGRALRDEDYDLYAVLEALFSPLKDNEQDLDWKQDLKVSLKKVRKTIV